jgi:ATP-dependent Clp protease ATP-binding subunit ClpA
VLAESLPYILQFPGHNYIGSEHLLLGLLREGEGVAARVLENLGADPSNIRTQASIMFSFIHFTYIFII